MEVAAGTRGAAAAAGGGGGGGGGGPAPFLLKTYEMVDDPSSDAVVSWSDASDGSFVVWNPPEFAARLLPTYFKHNNFSSFIRQLNTYGFHKIDPERWEFANEYFVKGQKYLLKNIHRRKPIHSHSLQPGSLPDNERAIFEDEIERLSREKAVLQADLWKFNQQQSGAMIQIEDLERRVLDMEQRQVKMLSFLQHASRNPEFVNKLIKMAEASPIFSDAFHKKRRLPELDYSTVATETTSFYDDHSTTSKQEMGSSLNQHFSDKLKLGLCPAMSENNLISLSTQSSHEDNRSGSPHGKHPDCDRMDVECLSLVPQMMELSDTGTSMYPSKSACFTAAVIDDGLLPCHLSLTLASSSMDVDRRQISNANGSTIDQGKDDPPEVTTGTMEKENGIGRRYDDSQSKVSCDAGGTLPPLQRDVQVATEDLAAAVPPVVVNDKFWEQFLTERPGCTETEEGSSILRRDRSREHKYEDTRNDRTDIEQLKL